MYIYSWIKKLKKNWSILWCNLEKVDFLVSHVVFYLTMEWPPHALDPTKTLVGPPLPLHGRYYILLKTKGAHVPRGRKYSYGEAWSNMNTIKRNWLPFTSVYINPNVTFIYYNQESVLWATHNVWYKHHIPNTHPCTSPSQHNEILFSMEKSYPPLVREPTQSGVRRKCSGMLNHTILGQTPKSNLAE